jgi:hypothetical protein
MQKWVVELIGSMIFPFAWLATSGNPYIMGMTLTAALLIGRMANAGYYSPLLVAAEWALGRLGGVEAIQLGLAQVAGLCLAIVATPVVGLDGTPSH